MAGIKTDLWWLAICLCWAGLFLIRMDWSILGPFLFSRDRELLMSEGVALKDYEYYLLGEYVWAFIGFAVSILFSAKLIIDLFFRQNKRDQVDPSSSPEG